MAPGGSLQLRTGMAMNGVTGMEQIQGPTLPRHLLLSAEDYIDETASI
jgi:hypothetical protein